MKIFMVVQGEYSDYHNVQCCATKERAEQLIEDLVKEDWNENEYLHMNKTFEEFRKEHIFAVGGKSFDAYEIEEYEVLE
jgi:hypothetical protein